EVTRHIRDDREIFILEREGREALLESLIDGLERDILTELTGEQDISDLSNRLLVPRFKIYRILGKHLKEGRIRRPTLEELKTAGVYMLQERRPKVALKLLERAFDLFPGDSDVVEALANTLEDLAEKRRAAAFYKILASRHMEGGDEIAGLEYCRKIGELQPNDTFAYEKLYDNAKSTSNKQELADSGRALVKIYHMRREFKKALAVGEEVLGISPGDIPLRQKMINIHLEAGNLDKAVGAFEALEGVIIEDDNLDGLEKDKELFRLYDKILRLDGKRKDIKSKMTAVQARLPMEERKLPEKRFVTLPRVLIALGLLAALGVGGFYLYQQRADTGLMKLESETAAMIKGGKISEAAEKFGEFARTHPWTAASEVAYKRQEKLQDQLLEVQRRQKEEEQTAFAKIKEAAELLGKAELTGARALYQEIRENYTSVIIINRAEEGLRRVDAKIRQNTQDTAEEKKKAFHKLLNQAKDCQNEEKDTQVLYAGLSLLDRARAELDAIDSLGAEGWEKYTQKNRRSVAEGLTRIETQLQGVYASRGLAEWSNRLGDLTKAREWLEKARILERDPEVHKRVLNGLEEIDGYTREAREIEANVQRIVGGVQDLRPERRKAAMRTALEEVRRLIIRYSKSPIGRNARIPVYVETDPMGCVVEIEDGRRLADETPAVVFYPHKERYNIRVRDRGYKPAVFPADGVTTYRNIALEKTYLWKYEVGGSIQASVTPWGAYVFSGSRDGVVHAVLLNPRTGKPERLWSPYKVDDFSGIKAKVAVSRTILFLCTASKGELHAVDTGTGLPHWPEPYRARRMVDHGPVPGEKVGLVFLGDIGGTVHALELATGKRRWSTTLKGGDMRIASAPVFFPGDPAALFVPIRSGVVVKLDAETGEERWRFNPLAGTPRRFRSEIVLRRGGDLLLVKRGKHLLAFSTGKGAPDRPTWSVTAREGEYSVPLVDEGAVVVGERGGMLTFLNLKDGERIDRAPEMEG
ncbi:MAG: outer membrane protein assembly factor BamB family protein, partial [Planctomycetota bacterium]